MIENIMYCDGSKYTETSSNLFCDVPALSVLRHDPYDLTFNQLVFAQVQALNSRGWSVLSPMNTLGQTIQTEPYYMNTPQRDDSTNTEQIVVDWSQISSP